MLQISTQIPANPVTENCQYVSTSTFPQITEPTAEAGSVNRKKPHIHAAIKNTHPAGPVANAYMLVCGRVIGLQQKWPQQKPVPFFLVHSCNIPQFYNWIQIGDCTNTNYFHHWHCVQNPPSCKYLAFIYFFIFLQKYLFWWALYIIQCNSQDIYVPTEICIFFIIIIICV